MGYHDRVGSVYFFPAIVNYAYLFICVCSSGRHLVGPEACLGPTKTAEKEAAQLQTVMPHYEPLSPTQFFLKWLLKV